MIETDVSLDDVKKVHFIGVGGIGVSAVARMMILEGKSVSGSDMTETEITKELVSLGADIHIGHDAGNLSDDADLVIYTVAVPESNPEMLQAGEKGIVSISYPQALNLISKGKYTVAIAGSHGKTTTTAMVADVLKLGDINPTVIVGSRLKSSGSNFIAGDVSGDKKEYFVVEACEFRRSFLNLNPNILVITNIDNDHLDYYKDIDDIKSAFRELALKVPEDGFVVCNPSGPNVRDVINGLSAKIVDYSAYMEKAPAELAGIHNKENAASALAVGDLLGVDASIGAEALGKFRGTWRRLESHGESKEGALLFDDYAHHPTEIKATIQALREKYTHKKITLIFQPHLYSRTKLLFDDFVNVLSLADKVILLPIYAAREKEDSSISSSMLADSLKQVGASVLQVETFEDVVSALSGNLSADDLVVTMGAGDVYNVISKI